jgi:hypothetical protein
MEVGTGKVGVARAAQAHVRARYGRTARVAKTRFGAMQRDSKAETSILLLAAFA